MHLWIDGAKMELFGLMSKHVIREQRAQNFVKKNTWQSGVDCSSFAASGSRNISQGRCDPKRTFKSAQISARRHTLYNSYSLSKEKKEIANFLHLLAVSVLCNIHNCILVNGLFLYPFFLKCPGQFYCGTFQFVWGFVLYLPWDQPSRYVCLSNTCIF